MCVCVCVCVCVNSKTLMLVPYPCQQHFFLRPHCQAYERESITAQPASYKLLDSFKRMNQNQVDLNHKHTITRTNKGTYRNTETKQKIAVTIFFLPPRVDLIYFTGVFCLMAWMQDGMLAPEELADCLDNIGVHLHAVDIAKIVKQMNQDQDGRVSYNEFLVRAEAVGRMYAVGLSLGWFCRLTFPCYYCLSLFCVSRIEAFLSFVIVAE